MANAHRIFRPSVEQLERRETPARLLAVSAEAKAILEDVDTLYNMPTEEMQTLLESLDIPKRDFCYVVERGVKDGNIWDGPVDANGNVQSENALIYLFRSYGVPAYSGFAPPENWGVEDYATSWYFGAWVEGCGENQQVYSELAAGWGVEMFQLTLEAGDDGKFLVDSAVVDMLQAAQIGDAFHACVLTNGLEADLGTYATEGQMLDEELGEIVGDGVLTLKLGVAVEGGFQVFTLTSGLDEFNLHTLWTLAGIDQVGSLTPQLGLWELKTT